MKHQAVQQRNVLFLQGPPGPFFWLLGERLRGLGCGIRRINLNGGDRADWPGEAHDYRAGRRRWALFIDRYMRDHRITDLVLFGDCRPMHMAAHQMAQLRQIAVHVFEEGYIRPDWVTLEQNGVNGRSSLSRDPRWYLEQARQLPPIPERPPITASFKRRARDSYWYYHRIITGRWRFPFYRSHRSGSILMEGFGWMYKFARERQDARRTGEGLHRLEGRPFFLFPLQLTNDYQIREHSPFQSMGEAADYVLYSFARRAPAHMMLAIKEHPLDSSFFNWRRFIKQRAKALGLADRVVHLAGGDLTALSARSQGMVTVNSTSATLALQAGVPVLALGKAIYNLPGLTHQGRIDEYWARPHKPEPGLYDAFRRVLYDRCLIYGGFASESAIATLVESTIERLGLDQREPYSLVDLPAIPLAAPTPASQDSTPAK
jgi:capsular polysaccharide export protein